MNVFQLLSFCAFVVLRFQHRRSSVSNPLYFGCKGKIKKKKVKLI